jgi:KUP system potassium uptake protein
MSDQPTHKQAVPVLALGALGVVYGDIGTSPLYAMRETFTGEGHELAVSNANVYGVLSLILRSLIVVITIKYLMFVMRAENDGEGGILALLALVRPSPEPRKGRRWLLLLLALVGAALLYGDAAITPAISVLSAVEGTEVATPALSRAVIPIAVVILVALFAIQRRGTTVIGRLFGPVMIVWFTTLAVLGVGQIVNHPGVWVAVNPIYAVHFFADNAFAGFLALGSVFLVVTGGEALYADMGHFGRPPIRLAWFALVLPALVLNYFGQGALLLDQPDAIESPLFKMVPEVGVYPLVVLATMATVIASQALISGVFSLTTQAIQLGYAPRHRIRHTSESSFGQVYIPVVNWALMAACIVLVIGFGSSAELAAAYGVAVTSTMAITTVLFYVVLRERFRWSQGRAVALCTVFMTVDLAFFGANLFKIPSGGWFPILVAIGMFTLMTTWHTGRRLVFERLRRNDIPLADYVESLQRTTEPPERVPGTAVYLFSTPGLAPPALVSNVRHNHVLHEKLVVLSIVTVLRPRVLPAQRATVTDLGSGVVQLTLDYGFMEDPDVRSGLRQGAASRLGIDPASTTFVLGSELIAVASSNGMAIWRERLFGLLVRNATPAAAYFGLPLERTITIATPVEV